MLRRRTRRMRRKSNIAHTKSILNAANNRAANWTIGSKRKAKSKAGRCRARRRARKAIRDVRGKGQSKLRVNRRPSTDSTRETALYIHIRRFALRSVEYGRVLDVTVEQSN